MAKYIVLGKMTQQARQAAVDIPKFRAQGRERAKAVGATFESYLTLGKYDVVWVVDAPNDEALAKWLFGLGSTGRVVTQTLRAFTEAEVDALTAGLPAQA
jgi:uncharacterized protein with GYD domain